jgi:hypothetical protein
MVCNVDCIEHTVADSRQGVILQLRRLGRRLSVPDSNKPLNYKILHRASDVTGLCAPDNESSGSIKGGRSFDQLND